MNDNQLTATQQPELTLTELAELLAVGTGASVDPGSIDDSTTFDDIGVDSLGLLGVITTIERGRGVGLPEDTQQIEHVTRFLAVVNDNLRKVG